MGRWKFMAISSLWRLERIQKEHLQVIRSNEKRFFPVWEFRWLVGLFEALVRWRRRGGRREWGMFFRSKFRSTQGGKPRVIRLNSARKKRRLREESPFWRDEAG
jgi:hypothetical protein